MPVTVANIAVALGQAAPEPDSVTAQQWQMWVEDAYMLIDARKSELGVSAPIDQVKLDYVVREAVVAHVRKPDDATEVTISVDDGSSSRRYQSGDGRVTIRPEWWSLLGLVESTQGAFAVDMIGSSLVHPPYCSLYFGGTCSCGVTTAGTPIFEGGGL